MIIPKNYYWDFGYLWLVRQYYKIVVQHTIRITVVIQSFMLQIKLYSSYNTVMYIGIIFPFTALGSALTNTLSVGVDGRQPRTDIENTTNN